MDKKPGFFSTLKDEVVRGLSPSRSRSKSPLRSKSPMSGLLRRRKPAHVSVPEVFIARSGSLRPPEMLSPLREGPEHGGAGAGGCDDGGWAPHWMKRNASVSGPGSGSGSGGSKRSDLRLLLGVLGAPLAPVHVSSLEPLPHLSIKDTPIVLTWTTPLANSIEESCQPIPLTWKEPWLSATLCLIAFNSCQPWGDVIKLKDLSTHYLELKGIHLAVLAVLAYLDTMSVDDKNKVTKVCVRGDSATAIGQSNGSANISDHTIKNYPQIPPLVWEIHALVDLFEHLTFEAVPRELNGVADFLADHACALQQNENAPFSPTVYKNLCSSMLNLDMKVGFKIGRKARVE